MAKVEEIDVRKTVCPMTVITVLRHLKSLVAGDRLEVLIADNAGVTSISREMGKKGHLCEIRELKGGEWKLSITIR